MWPELKDIDYVNQYFPDFDLNEYPEREYFFNIVSTIYPDELRSVVITARKNRAVAETEDKDELIQMESSIKKEIMSVLSMKSTSFLKTLLLNF
jgi:hypothetical protein